jgi:hypothetical protein
LNDSEKDERTELSKQRVAGHEWPPEDGDKPV